MFSGKEKFFMREFSFKRGVLYFAAVAAAFALAVVQIVGVGGVSTTAAADEDGNNSATTTTAATTTAAATTTTATTAKNPSKTTAAVAATTVAETTEADDYYYEEEPTTAAATPTQVSISSTASSASVAKTIEKLAEGSTATVDMSATKTISKDVLKAAKDEKVELVLDMGGYKWSIDASQISTELHDVNMNVSFGTSTEIPQNEIASVAGNDSYQTISLDYDGDFGFTASLGFNVGSANAGKYVNLYYYNKNNELEYQNSGIVDAKGDTSVVFSHASEYVAIISDTVPVTVNSTSATSPVTADFTSAVPYVVLMLSAAAAMLGTFGFKKKND
jgi:hypothetical protein